VKEMVTGKIKTIKVTDEHKIRRNTKTTNIISCVEDKAHKIVFDKRVLNDDYSTSPYGM
jgi:hypothetical protein